MRYRWHCIRHLTRTEVRFGWNPVTNRLLYHLKRCTEQSECVSWLWMWMEPLFVSWVPKRLQWIGKSTETFSKSLSPIWLQLSVSRSKSYLNTMTRFTNIDRLPNFWSGIILTLGVILVISQICTHATEIFSVTLKVIWLLFDTQTWISSWNFKITWSMIVRGRHSLEGLLSYLSIEIASSWRREVIFSQIKIPLNYLFQFKR